MSKKFLVALARGLDVQENVTRVFNIMSGAAKMIELNSAAVLKPNAGHAVSPEFAVCTYPETARAIIREVKKADPKHIVIAEAVAVGCDIDECYEACGIAAIAREESVELVDIKKDKNLINIAAWGHHSNISCAKLPRLLLGAERIINLPILKARASMVFSGILRDIKGVVQDQAHAQIHQQNLTVAVTNVWWAHRVDINIMDVMHTASGYSSHTPVPIEVDCIMGSYDPVALNRTACELVSIDSDGVDYFRVAQEAGLGTTNHSDVEVVGDKAADCYKKVWVPYLRDIRNCWLEYEIHCEGACSNCQALLILNMEMLKVIGAYDGSTDMVVVAGGRNTLSPDTPDEKILLRGNCARRHPKEHPNVFFLQGCPPGKGSLYMSMLRKEAVTDKSEQIHWICERMEIDTLAWHPYVGKGVEKLCESDDK